MSESKRITLYAAPVRGYRSRDRTHIDLESFRRNRRTPTGYACVSAWDLVHAAYNISAQVRLALEEAKANYDVIWIDLVDKPEWYAQKVNTEGGKVSLTLAPPPMPASIDLSRARSPTSSTADPSWSRETRSPVTPLGSQSL